jgi:hypothetical protein
VYFERVPDETTLLRWLRVLRPETLHDLNDRVVQLAVQAKVTSGRKLRLDATCVQTEIHHPTDRGLLVDSVRVLSRFVKGAKELVKEQVSYVEQTCRARVRTARKTAQTLHRQLRRKGEDKEAEQKQLYQKLVETTEQMVQQGLCCKNGVMVVNSSLISRGVPFMSHQHPFKWRHFEARIILLCVRWYLRYALSYRESSRDDG